MSVDDVSCGGGGGGAVVCGSSDVGVVGFRRFGDGVGGVLVLAVVILVLLVFVVVVVVVVVVVLAGLFVWAVVMLVLLVLVVVLMLMVEVFEMVVMIIMMMMISWQVLIFNETSHDSGSQRVPREYQGIHDQFPKDPWMYFCNRYFEMYLFL